MEQISMYVEEETEEIVDDVRVMSARHPDLPLVNRSEVYRALLGAALRDLPVVELGGEEVDLSEALDQYGPE